MTDTPLRASVPDVPQDSELLDGPARVTVRRFACIALPEIQAEIAGAPGGLRPPAIPASSGESGRAVLVRVAEAAMAFGPAVAFDVEQRVVWVEIGGCAHLHGGERELARKLDSGVCALGHECRIAIAGGPRIAAAVARYASALPFDVPQGPPFVVPEGRAAAAVRSLPIAALGLDDDVAAWLSDLGLRTCGDLQKLPRRALGVRLGVRARDVFQLLDGEDRTPIEAWRPPEAPEERIELEWGTSSLGDLAFVIESLCDRLAARLQGRAMAAACIELVLGLDSALCGGSPPRSKLRVEFPSPLSRAGDLCAALRARLEREALIAPVLSATLRAPALARAASPALDLWNPEPKAARALPRLVAELEAWLEPENVGTLELVDTWVPCERTRLVPFATARAPGHAASHALVTSALEPSRLVRPYRVARESFALAELLTRIEAVEWWRRSSSRRDMAAAWTVVGAQPGRPPVSAAEGEPRADPGASSLEAPTHALAWVELAQSEGEDHVTIRGWID